MNILLELTFVTKRVLVSCNLYLQIIIACFFFNTVSVRNPDRYSLRQPKLFRVETVIFETVCLKPRLQTYAQVTQPRRQPRPFYMKKMSQLFCSLKNFVCILDIYCILFIKLRRLNRLRPKIHLKSDSNGLFDPNLLPESILSQQI